MRYLLLVLPFAGCGGAALRDLPPVERAPVCRAFGNAPAGTFGCSADQVPGFRQPGGVTYQAILNFRADGRLDSFKGLRAVVGLTEMQPKTPRCVEDELRGWQLPAAGAPLSFPITLNYVGGPTDFRESVLTDDTCAVRITIESR